MRKNRAGIGRAGAMAMMAAAGAILGCATFATAQVRPKQNLTQQAAQAVDIKVDRNDADRQWIAAYWAWVDAGRVGPGPAKPRLLTPRGIPVETDPLRPARDMIRAIYAHRLQENALLPAYYTVGNLLQDDPEAAMAFRTFSQQGLLRVSQGDQRAYITHLQLLASVKDAGVTMWIEGDAVVSKGLSTHLLDSPQGADDQRTDGIASKLPPGSAPPTEPPKPPTRDEIDRRLREPGKPPTQIDLRPPMLDKPGKPGYDCDDDAEALAAWLLKKFPGGQQINIMFCGTGNEDGKGKTCHMVSVLVYGDKYYIVDGSSGKVLGPFDMPLTDENLKQQLKDLWEQYYKYAMYPDIRIDPGRYKPNDRSPWAPDEPLPWWHDPEVRAAFCRALNIPAGECDERIRRDYIHPSPVGPLPGEKPQEPEPQWPPEFLPIPDELMPGRDLMFN